MLGLIAGVVNFEFMVRDDYYDNANRPADEDPMQTVRFKSTIT